MLRTVGVESSGPRKPKQARRHFAARFHRILGGFASDNFYRILVIPSVLFTNSWKGWDTMIYLNNHQPGVNSRHRSALIM